MGLLAEMVEVLKNRENWSGPRDFEPSTPTLARLYLSLILSISANFLGARYPKRAYSYPGVIPMLEGFLLSPRYPERRGHGSQDTHS